MKNIIAIDIAKENKRFYNTYMKLWPSLQEQAIVVSYKDIKKYSLNYNYETSNLCMTIRTKNNEIYNVSMLNSTEYHNTSMFLNDMMNNATYGKEGWYLIHHVYGVISSKYNDVKILDDRLILKQNQLYIHIKYDTIVDVHPDANQTNKLNIDTGEYCVKFVFSTYEDKLAFGNTVKESLDKYKSVCKE